MEIKLIASDLDGTIIDRNNNISEKNFDAIKQIHNKNIKFVICTGKSYSVSKHICKQFNASYGIFGNGAQIIDLHSNQELFRKTLSQQDLLFLSTLSKHYNFHIHLYTDNEIITENLEYMDLRNYILNSQKSTDNLNFKIVNNITDYIEKSNPYVFSAIISTENNTLEEFEKILSINSNIKSAYITKRGKYRDTIINKDYEYINVSASNINKNDALNFLGNYLNISKKNILAIGDNVNDFEMIKNAGIGVAVKDSYDDLKKIAKYITKSSTSEGAFAEAIFKFIIN